MIKRNLAILIFCYLSAGVSQTTVDARLAEYRTQIDGVDRQIVELLNKRAAIVQRVGALKREAGLPIAAPDRERKVLDNAVETGKNGPLPPATLRRIYERIVQEMTAWEASGGK